MKRILLSILSAGTLIFATGCAGISMQSYGSINRGYRVTDGATRADVILGLGEPDSIYRSEDVEVLVYKGYEGSSYFGIYNSLQRDDLVVVLDATKPEGPMLTSRRIEVGKGMTLFSSPLFDATYPVSSDELTEEPENYSYPDEN